MKLLSGWLFSGINILSGIILLPLILTKFSAEEINVWFLFFSIVGLSEIAVLGFNTTFSRFISYTVAGIFYKDFNHINSNGSRSELKDKTKQLSDLYTINVFIFIIIGIVYVSLMFLFGYFSLRKPISFLSNPSDGWFAWYILLVANAIRIFLYTYPVFLQGMNKMVLFYNIQSGFRLGYIMLGLAVLLYTPSLFMLSSVLGLSIILSAFFMTFIFKKKNKEITITKFNKGLFSIIWDSAWKSGITKILAPIIQYSSGIIFAQFASAGLSGSYLLTQRLFDILQGFSTVTFSTYMPQLAVLRSKGDFEGLKKLIRKLNFLGFGLLILGYLVIISAGSYVLILMESKTLLAPYYILILFSFAYLFNRIGGFQLDLANQANRVMEHKAIVIYAFIYFGMLLINFNNLTMWVFPLSMILAQVFTFIFTSFFSYPLYNTSFWKAEKFVTIPMVILLVIINLVYYIICSL